MIESKVASFCAAMCGEWHHDQCEAWVNQAYWDTLEFVEAGRRFAQRQLGIILHIRLGYLS